jgi:hypothetical protein
VASVCMAEVVETALIDAVETEELDYCLLSR